MLKAYIKKLINVYFLQSLEKIQANQNDILAMQYLTPISESYLPWSDSAIRPSGLVTVLNEITLNSYSTVVEFGGGISTFYIAKILKENTGKLLVFEHDEKWVDILRKKLRSQNLDDTASVIFAPLEPLSINDYNDNWYSIATVKENLEGLDINLVLVDGPPAYYEAVKYVRYPAVSVVKEFLGTRFTVVLDDADRDGEQWIIKQWEKELGVKFNLRLINGGIAIGRSTPRLNINI